MCEDQGKRIKPDDHRTGFFRVDAEQVADEATLLEPAGLGSP